MCLSDHNSIYTYALCTVELYTCTSWQLVAKYLQNASLAEALGDYSTSNSYILSCTSIAYQSFGHWMYTDFY